MQVLPRRRQSRRILSMFSRNHGKPHTETYRFSATPTLSDFPLLIGEMLHLSDLRSKRQASRRSLFQGSDLGTVRVVDDDADVIQSLDRHVPSRAEAVRGGAIT